MEEGGGGAFTCGAERDEGLRVLADHPQLVFGEGQPSDDVLHKVVGGDRRHVPLQLPQDDQLPVLKAEPDRQTDHRTVNKRTMGSSNHHPTTPPPLRYFFFPGKGSAALLHFSAPRCILLSACLSHSSHPLD